MWSLNGGTREEKIAAECKDFLSEVVGGRCAITFAGGPCTTVSFDRVDVIVPIVHGDLVRVEGQVVSVGSSSIIIYVRALRHDLLTREFKTAAYSYITYVAIDPKTLRPNKNIPALKSTSEAEIRMNEEAKRRKKLSEDWRGAQKLAASREDLLEKAFEQSKEGTAIKRELLTIPETEVVVRKQMLPRHNNHLNIIFGGDVLRWMLGVATLTAKRFTGNMNMIVVSMNRIDFKNSIKPEHVVEMRARVVSARYYVVEVEIEAFIDRSFEGKGVAPSHNGYFTVLNLDELGFRRPITVGLKIAEDDQDSIMRYAKAIARREFDSTIVPPDEGASEFWTNNMKDTFLPGSSKCATE